MGLISLPGGAGGGGRGGLRKSELPIPERERAIADAARAAYDCFFFFFFG